MRRIAGVTAVLSLVAGGIPAAPAGAVFPGRNGKILYVSGYDGLRNYSTMNPDGSGKKEILVGRRRGFQAQFTSDGKRIAFDEELHGLRGRGGLDHSHLFTMNTDGSEVRELSDTLSDEGSPSWSPDGSQIVFERDHPQVSTDIWVMNRDGSGARPLLQRPNHDFYPRWSPDGRRIAFISLVENGTDPLPEYTWFTALNVMDSDGTNVRQILDVPPESMVVGFDWSPDGRQLLFDFWKAPSYKTDLFIVRPDGTGLRGITKTPKDDEYLPVWSPDGKKILFVSDWDGDEDVYMMNVDGTGRKKLTHDTVDNWPYDWQSRR